MKDAGLKRDALYFVRPDDYVALASSVQSLSKVSTFVEPGAPRSAVWYVGLGALRS
jgi:hypothetical protein